MNDNNIYIKLGWVRPVIIERYKGITPDALRKRRERGMLIEGQHWKKIGGSVMYHFENIDEYFGNAAEAA